jgi:hypothetical protein
VCVVTTGLDDRPRYRIRPPAVEQQLLLASSGLVEVLCLNASDPNDQERLWKGLVADRSPVQAVGRKGPLILWVRSPREKLLTTAVELLGLNEVARGPSPLEWLTTILPRDIPGLWFYQSQFLYAISGLEAKVGGPVRSVYQATYQIVANLPPGLKIAQAEFWVPRRDSELDALAESLVKTRTSEHTILAGKGVAIRLTTRTDTATRILLEVLTTQGFKLWSPVPVFSSRPSAPPPTASPPPD